MIEGVRVSGCRTVRAADSWGPVLLILLVSWLPSCTTSKADQELSGPLADKLEELLHRVQYSQGLARLGDLRELSAFGKAATRPVKERLLKSDNPQLRSNAVYVLGEIYRLDRDREALEAVRGAMSDRDRLVRLEAARALLESGDYGGVDELLEALDDPGRGIRARAFLALSDAAGGVDFGYRAAADSASRQEPIARFRAYFARSGFVP